MCFDESQSIVEDRPEKPARKGRRVLNARQAARREKVLSHLINPVVAAEDPKSLTDRATHVYQAFKPRNGWQEWLTLEIAVLMVRINRCSLIERKLRDWASYRAIDFWEDDQKVEVETLATKIERDPARVVAKMRQTPTGIDWLLSRWRILAKVEPKDWTEAQMTLAKCLVGGEVGVDPTEAGFAVGRVAELTEMRERVEEADAIARGLVEADLSDDKVPDLARLRRYTKSLQRQMTWYVDQFHIEHSDRWDDPMRRPASDSPAFQTADNARKPHWTYAETNPPIDKTKPIAVAEASVEPIVEDDETKPTPSDSGHESGETKPIEPSEFGGLMPQTVSPHRVGDQRPAGEPFAGSDWKNRLDSVPTLDDRQKASRRRLSMAGVPGS